MARKMLMNGYDNYTDPVKIRFAQEAAQIAYEQARAAASAYSVQGNVVTKRTYEQMELEPCATCDLILYCRDNNMTCSVFRAYVAQAGGKQFAFQARVPDKTWDESFPKDKDSDA